MASPSVGGRPTCVSWLVLFSYAVLLFIGLVGLWLWGINFGYQEASPPTPPPENITATTTTTPPPSANSYYYRERHEVPQAYKDYVDQTTIFAQLTIDARFYLAPLCLVCLVVGGFMLLVGLCSRRLFGSTCSLYSSLCLWILTLVMAIIYQNNQSWRPFPSFADTTVWVLSYHLLLLLFLPLQMLLCVWELRRQQAKDWPTLNFRSIFTMEAVLLASRLTLTGFTFAVLLHSMMFRGFRGESDPRYEDSYYETPRVRYPIQLALVCFSAACFNAVATMETALSMLLGKLHRFMTTLTCLLSGLCCVSIAVLCSPIFVRLAIGPYTMYPGTMNWAIGLSLVTLLHWLARLILPSTLSTPPRILTLIMDRLAEVTSLSDIVAMIQTQGNKGMVLLPKTMKNMKYGKHIKVASVIFSIISLAIIGVSAGDTPTYKMWGHVMVLCANTVTILRTLPPLVTEYFHQEMEIIPVKQRLFGLAVETVALFVGGIVVCNTAFFGMGVFGGILNILFAVFQMLFMWSLYKGISQSQPCEDMERLTEGEEATSQEGDQTSPPDAMA